MKAVTAAFLVCLASAAWCNDVVFSARKYVMRGGKVYPVGHANLYRVHQDGTGLRRLTNAAANDVDPKLSPDGREIRFSRCLAERNIPFTMRLDGSNPRGYAGKELKPLTRFPYRLKKNSREDVVSILDKRGRAVRTIKDAGGNPAVSPSGRFCVVATYAQNSPSGSAIVDLLTGKVEKSPIAISAPAWIDDERYIANHEPKGEGKATEMAVINRHGKAVNELDPSLRKGTPPHPHPGFGHTLSLSDADPLECDGSSRKLYPLPWGRDLALLTNFHFMSDGGYGSIYKIDFSTGDYEFVDFETVADLTPDKTHLLGLTHEWIGGYKRPGADLLSQLYLWDLKTLKCTHLGFPLMDCAGACFLNGKS